MSDSTQRTARTDHRAEAERWLATATELYQASGEHPDEIPAAQTAAAIALVHATLAEPIHGGAS